MKVKKAALGVMGKFHVQLGPAFEALVFSSVKDESLRDQLQKTFSEHAYDPTTSKSDFPKHSIVATQKGGGSNNTGGDVFELEMPKLDLLAELPADCLARMVSSVVGWWRLFLNNAFLIFLESIVFQRKQNVMEGEEGGNGGG